MISIYIIEQGVSPWSSVITENDSSLRTLTIVFRSMKDAVTILSELFQSLSVYFPRMYRWYTLGPGFFDNKTQTLKAQRSMQKDLQGFQHTIYQKAVEENCYCLSAEFILLLTQRHIEALSGNNRTVACIVHHGIEDSDKSWKVMAAYAKGFDAHALKNALNIHPNIIFARCYEDDVHVAFQFYTSVANMPHIVVSLQKLGSIEVFNNTDIAAFINTP